ncbi:MAG TPA: hypothetical protein VIJ93_08670 [bacterium]
MTFKPNAISPKPARTIADLELDEKVYKPDFEITEKFQAFSKELVRISLLGLGVYGFLIKMAADEKGDKHLFLQAMRDQKIPAMMGVVAFALCAASALFQGFLATKCLSHQLIISRYFGRLEGNRWDEKDKESFRNTIKENQVAQKCVLKWGGWLLFTATIALICGAVLMGLCSGLVLFNG